ncbi:DUF2490 domain-containing protein [Flavihumibacter fluvii]|uniref:DUF2490 domain-containing protein n=1 Tax=Flavihumibacter fluvii TaxID=2838157 RepID=UPI001BDF5040|nr:DUF2490 domain-containing protein [Flavihumibacter fluvii]ULQ54116.1 DUF2490 domain-containing protein [Flavihumibacter fluvii]
MLKLLRLFYLGFFASLFGGNSCTAQNSSFEFWPETDIWYRLNPSWRFSAFIPITKYNESKDRDLNIYLQADYAWGKTKRFTLRRLMDDIKAQQMKGWLARGGFMEGWSLGENAGEYTEDMLFAEIHRRSPIKGGILISNRFRTDFRWVGQEPVFSYRLRYRIMIEKEYFAGRSSIIPYVNAEPYWDSRYSTINRVRLIGGATVVWGSRFAYEGNLTYQYDEHYNTENLYALNIILHIFFEAKHAK